VKGKAVCVSVKGKAVCVSVKGKAVCVSVKGKAVCISVKGKAVCISVKGKAVAVFLEAQQGVSGLEYSASSPDRYKLRKLFPVPTEQAGWGAPNPVLTSASASNRTAILQVVKFVPCISTEFKIKYRKNYIYGGISV
jgi:hypothetical protein